MRYEIYTTNRGETRVNIGEKSYGLLPANPLSHREETVGGQITSHDLEDVLHGSYGDTVKAWTCAALLLQVPARFFSWREKSMSCKGVAPPWLPRPRDWDRDLALSVSVGDSDNGLDAPLVHVLEAVHA